MQTTNCVNEVKAPLMSQLSESLGKDVQALTRYLDSAGYGQPSWGRDTPTNVLPVDAPTDIQIARESIMETAMQLFQLAAGPAQYNNNIKNAVRFHPTGTGSSLLTLSSPTIGPRSSMSPVVVLLQGLFTRTP